MNSPRTETGCWGMTLLVWPVRRGMDLTRFFRSHVKSPEDHICSICISGEIRLKPVPSLLGSLFLLFHNGFPSVQGGLYAQNFIPMQCEYFFQYPESPFSIAET